MTTSNDTERQLRSLFTEVAPVRPPDDLFGSAMQAIEAAAQRPAWRGRSAAGLSGPVIRPRAIAGVLVGLTVLGLIAGLLALAGRPHPRLLPDVQILYQRDVQLGGGLFGLGLDGSNDGPLLESLPGVHTDADWSPDGERLVFADADTGQLWIADADGSDARPIAYCQVHPACGKPAWSPDGGRIAFTVSEKASMDTGLITVLGDAAREIDVVDISTGLVSTALRLERPLLADAARWSPDGRQLLVGVLRVPPTSMARTGSSLAVVDADGGDPRYLTGFEQYDYSADWSVRTGSVVYGFQDEHDAMEGPAADAAWNLFVTRVDGGQPRQLTQAPAGVRLWFPTWSPDGSWIVAANQATRQAVRVDAATGAITAIGGIDVDRPLARPTP